ncbi:MAG: hypothetical protein EOO73_31035 [Myxococcales bacterium]|nr:MAG: hypothetical protein EOO73_31035 [Myxococcales bacterium]
MCALGVLALGCGGDDSSSTSDAPAAEEPKSKAGDAQTPPTTNGADVEEWLKKGDYKNWTCEKAEHPQIKVSPHGYNRVCSNDLAATFTGSVDDERPVDTASVKELYDDSSSLVGYAVSVKVKAASSGGDNWYWYERVTLGSAAPPESSGVAADGLGSDSAVKRICVGCHAGAGSDAQHAVTGSSDYVYLQAEAADAPNPDGD